MKAEVGEVSAWPASVRTPVHNAGLVHTAVMSTKQVGMGREELEHFGKAARSKAVVVADARALLKMDSRSAQGSELGLTGFTSCGKAEFDGAPDSEPA